ncbi:hypothetical protein MYAM1_000704 [Malassezia yamatoensis]|uniref:Cep57 centrosome microtubule-binding domain-containing protein n=1 Tax=Malassezia yamatoensis TaxID=253288 RepID=A0AAJ5YP72_9BASI|nr:hypothetical protein MYAM1_000704 [Malassezia yamatoensis]
MVNRRLSGSFSIPVSSEEWQRRKVEGELGMRLGTANDIPTSSFLSESGLRHSTATRAYARRLAHERRASYSEESESSGDERINRILSESTGNHTMLLATPRAKANRQRLHTRPKLSRYAKDHLNISRMARVDDASDDEDIPAKPKAPTREPSSQGSRHSSAETKVNEETPAQLPNNVRWAEQQLHALVSCIQNMERDINSVRGDVPPTSSTSLDLLQRRTAALEIEVDAHKHQLAKLCQEFNQFKSRESPEPAERLMPPPLPAQSSARATREPVYSPPVPTPAGMSAQTIQRAADRLHEELARISEAVELMQKTASRSHHGAPLTPPYDSRPRGPLSSEDPYSANPPNSRPQVRNEPTTTPAADRQQTNLQSAQERYEQVCHAVAEAMGLHTPLSGLTSQHTRRDQIRADLRSREAAETTTESLLRRMHEVPPPIFSDAELRMLEQAFEQHRREFLQQKELYSELAEELKRMEPTMDRMKRRILADHLHESIDTLEAEATRLNDLHAHLARHGRVARYDGHNR